MANRSVKIRSMTGYGQGSAELNGLRITAEFRTVNGRFAELRFRMPSELGGLEADIRRKVLARVRRGRVQLTVSVDRADDATPASSFNRNLAADVVAAGQTLQEEFGLPGPLDVRTALLVSGMFRGDNPQVTWDEAERTAFSQAVNEGLEALDADRGREGGKLQEELTRRVDAMTGLVDGLREAAAGQPEMVRARLVERLGKVADDVEIDPQRIAQEALMLADRSDVTEELVRLDGHLEQLQHLVGEPDGKPVGKRLEFLLQEVQRETNTVGSKSAELTLSRTVLALKAEIEKAREQVQNLE